MNNDAKIANNCTSDGLALESNHELEKKKILIEQWKRMLDFAENNSERRIKINNTYLAINSLLLGSSSYISEFQARLLSICGIFISILWFMSLATYRTSNSVRYEVIRDIERELILSPVSDEYSKLKNRKIYFGNTIVEMVIPIVFVILFFITFKFAPILLKEL